MTDTSDEAVERLAAWHEASIICEGDVDNTTAATLRALLAERDAYRREMQATGQQADMLLAEIDRLRGALVDHNDMLRSAYQAAKRDAAVGIRGTTNYRALADRTLEVLGRHHTAVNAARAALGDDRT